MSPKSLLILLILVSSWQIGLLVQPVIAQSYDYVFQNVEAEMSVISPQEAHAKYSITVRNLQLTGLDSWSPPLDPRLTSPGYTLTFTKVYDSVGALDYTFTPGKASSFKVAFRKGLTPGQSYGFSYEFSVKWDYNSYGWVIYWGTTRIIENIRLRILVSDQLRIVSTNPAGAFSDDRKTAERQASNVKSSYLWASYPPTTGKWSILTLLAEFKDLKHSLTRDEISKKILQDMASYYNEISYGQISIVGDTTEWVTLPKTLAEYNISKWGSTDQNHRNFENDVIKAADDTVDFSRYDAVIIVTAGIYHQSVWAYSPPARMFRTNDHTTIERLTVQTEDSPWDTFAHEFGHTLGLPDLYDNTIAAKPGVYLEAAIYMGGYDLMSRSDKRPSMGGWDKLTLGWLPSNSVMVISPGDVRTVKIEKLESLSSGIMLVKIPISSKQYYLVEVRDRVGYDSVLPRSGVLITFANEQLDSGNGPLRLVDANPSTSSLDDAPFDLGPESNSTYVNSESHFQIVLLQKENGSYSVQFTRPT